VANELKIPNKNCSQHARYMHIPRPCADVYKHAPNAVWLRVEHWAHWNSLPVVLRSSDTSLNIF